MTFQLDTTGIIARPSENGFIYPTEWSDLSPFTQGYIEALFADLNGRRVRATSDGLDPYAFSDLAPETVTRIIADCEGRLQQSGDMGAALPTVKVGRSFWTMRQAGKRVDMGFPPLTVRLGDDGKVRFA